MVHVAPRTMRKPLRTPQVSRASSATCRVRSAAAGIAAVFVHGHAVHAVVPDAVDGACVFAILDVLALCGKIIASMVTIDAVVGVALAVM